MSPRLYGLGGEGGWLVGLEKPAPTPPSKFEKLCCRDSIIIMLWDFFNSINHTNYDTVYTEATLQILSVIQRLCICKLLPSLGS